uniref:Uncharacterized protein n=1 Tax=Caenorhabditis japonica TaxID=281687 RepID=A0A8R1EWM3_CAEJA
MLFITAAEMMRKREIALGNTECVIASLHPTIGTTHLIPQWDCLAEISEIRASPNNSQPLNVKPPPQQTPLQIASATEYVTNSRRPKPVR